MTKLRKNGTPDMRYKANWPVGRPTPEAEFQRFLDLVEMAKDPEKFEAYLKEKREAYRKQKRFSKSYKKVFSIKYKRALDILLTPNPKQRFHTLKGIILKYTPEATGTTLY